MKRFISCLLVLLIFLKGGVSEEESVKFKVSFDEVVKEVKVLLQVIYG